MLGGAKAATQEYCPPATGYMEHISAMGIATAIVTALTAMKLNTITGGPPEVMPTMNTPHNAVQLLRLAIGSPNAWAGVNTNEVTMLKLNPIMPKRPKDRLSSNHRQKY